MKKILLLLLTVLTAMTAWASTFTVTNNGNTFTITRTSSGTETVYYRTVSLSAFPGENYSEAVGTLTFTGTETQKTVTITEIDPSTYLDPDHDTYELLYIIQTTLGRSYRFEVFNGNGEILAYTDREMKDSNSKYYRMPANCSNTIVEDLVYFDDDGNLMSGEGNKYVDVAAKQISGYPESSGWRKVTDDGYGQGYCQLSTDLFNGAYVARIYAQQQEMKVYATVIFKQKEDDDGYQYIQILGNNKDTYDDIDPDGAVNDPSISIYKACFELSKSGVTSSPHYQFFPHRHDYVNKAAEQAAQLTHYSFDYDNSYLYQQKFVHNGYRALTSGSMILSPTDMYIYARFDAAGKNDDDWYFADLKLRLALVDIKHPRASDNYKVNGGLHTRSNPIYVSVPFSEIVTVTGTPKLYTTWGELNYIAGSGSNVLTFGGNISNTATGTFTIDSISRRTVTDLAGNNLSTAISKYFNINLDARTFSITYNLDGGSASNPNSYTDLGGDITLNRPSRANYEFLGWTGSNGTTPQLDVTIPSGSSGDKSYTANWKYIRYTYNSTTKELRLIRGEFSKNDKWGSDVPVSQVTNVSAASEVSFTGDCSQLFYGFTNCTSMDLNSLNTANVTNMSQMFQDCTSLTSLNILSWNTANVTDMSLMFQSCLNLTSLNISSWNTGNVTNMSQMFQGCSKLTSLNILSWNTGNVTNMFLMFHGCSNLTSLDLSNWNTTNVTDMTSMFHGCSMLTSIDLSGWDVGRAALMKSMFRGCNSLTSVNLSGWNIGDNCVYVFTDNMFQYCNMLTTIYATTSWDDENINNSIGMFDSCSRLVGGCGTTFDSNFTDQTYARIDRGTEQPGYFTGVFKLTLPTNVSASPDPIFLQSSDRYYAVGTTVTLTYTDNLPDGYVPVYTVNGTAIEGNTFQMPLGDATVTVEIKNTRYTYDSATGALTLLRGEFNKDNKWGNEVVATAVTSVTATDEVSFTGDCSYLFYNFSNCTSMDLSSVNTDSVTNMEAMFSQCESLTSLNVTGWNTSNVTDMRGLFYDCKSMTTFNVSNWNTGNVTNMGDMFSECTALTSLDLSSWNVSNVDDMGYMFYKCSNLTTLDISNWNTANVTNLSSMFNDCTSLDTLDLSGWNTGNAVSMSDMFSGCTSLTTIYAGLDWSTEKVIYSGFMFEDCTSLVGGMGTTYNANYTNKEYARIDGGPDSPGYLTSKLPRYTYDSTTGALTLNWGVFNSDNKWGSEVVANAVTSVTATNKVSFTGNCSDLFKNFTNCLSIDLSGVNTSEVTSMSGMFENCSSLTSLDLSNWNTYNAENKNYMFKGCSSLSTIDVSNFNTSMTPFMMGMFQGCSSLVELDLSNWDTRNGTHMSSMFEDCSKLRTIYAGGGWTVQWVMSSNSMFYGCTSLKGGMGTTYSASHTDKEYARIDGGPTSPGYFTDPNAVVVVPGDVNGDGDVTSADVTALYNYLLNGDETYLSTSDVDGDGNITSGDITFIYNILLGNK